MNIINVMDGKWKHLITPPIVIQVNKNRIQTTQKLIHDPTIFTSRWEIDFVKESVARYHVMRERRR